MRTFFVKSPMNLSIWEGGEIDIDALIGFTVEEGAVEITRFQFSMNGCAFAKAPKEIVRRFEANPSFIEWLKAEADKQLAYERDEAAEAVELKDLVGLSFLDAVDFETVQEPEYEGSEYMQDSSVCRFRLGGTVYVATEDPNDGYRSSMRHLRTSRKKMANVFPSVQVLGRHIKRRGYNECDILELLDTANGEVILEVGTDNSDDYYPSFVASFHPENMAQNAGEAE